MGYGIFLIMGNAGFISSTVVLGLGVILPPQGSGEAPGEEKPRAQQVSGFGFNLGFRVSGLGFRVSALRFRVSCYDWKYLDRDCQQ